MEIPRHWRLRAQRYRLEGSTCPICGHRTFPPRAVCLNCPDQAARIASCELAAIPAANRVVDTDLFVSRIR